MDPGQGPQQRSECFAVPLGVMQPGTVAPVDLYIGPGDGSEVILYKSAGAPLQEETRSRLLERGVARLFLSKKDERTYREYVEANLEAIIRDDIMPREEVSQLVYESSSRVMGDVFENPRSGGHLRRARRMVEATVQAVLKDPSSLWCMASVASHDYYTYTHCVNVGMFMAAAAHDILGVTDRQELNAIGLGGVFHDIGKTEVPEQILSKPGKLTAEEFEIIKKHPVNGLELVLQHQKLAPVSSHIIRHHHERFAGGGYPSSKPEADMPAQVRLATIVDVYDALTTNRSYAKARTPFAALELMMEQMNGHFDPDLLKAFVRFLGPRDLSNKVPTEWRVAVHGGAVS